MVQAGNPPTAQQPPHGRWRQRAQQQGFAPCVEEGDGDAMTAHS